MAQLAGGQDEAPVRVGTLLPVLTTTVLVRLIPAVFLGVEAADIANYRETALALLRNQDIFDVPTLWHYPPLSLFLPLLALRVAEATRLPFDLIIKVYPIAADVGITLLVFLLARRRWTERTATLAAVGYALNPVSVLITGFQGQFMPASVFFAFWAYYLLVTAEPRRVYLLSALALGIAIGFRSWPVLLVPILLRPGMALSLRQKAGYVIVGALPTVLTLGLYWPFNVDGIQREIFQYLSTPDFGWVGIWRCKWLIDTGNLYLPGLQAQEWTARSRLWYLVAYGALAALAWSRPRLLETADWIVAALLLNFTIVGSVAAQYYGWILPFLLFRPYFYSVFSLVAGGAVAAFYLVWHPQLLFGFAAVPPLCSRENVMPWFFVLLLATWWLGVAGLVDLAGTALRRARAGVGDGGVDPFGFHALPAGRPEMEARSRWVIAGISALTAGVVLAVAVEVPYLLRSRPARELGGSIVWVSGRRGSAPGELNGPVNLMAHPDGSIYEADVNNRRVQRFGRDGSLLGVWPMGSRTSERVAQPVDVAIGAAGEVLVLDAAGAIYRLGSGGQMDLAIDLRPYGVRLAQGLASDAPRHRLYVTDSGRSRVLVLRADGGLDATWGDNAAGGLRFERPAALAVDMHGNVFTLERRLSRVRRLSLEGAVLAEWRVPGVPFDLAVGPGDRVCITAADRPRVWVYEGNGTLVGQINAPFVAARQLPTRGIAVLTAGEIAIGTEGAIMRVSIDAPG